MEKHDIISVLDLVKNNQLQTLQREAETEKMEFEMQIFLGFGSTSTGKNEIKPILTS